MYVPLNEQDYAVYEDLRYRLGHWLRNEFDRPTAVAAFAAFGVPLAVIFDSWTGDLGTERPRVYVALLVIWIVAVLLVYARWFEHRQAVSERRRGYRFYVFEDERDMEIAGAKEALLSTTSTDRERQEALGLLLARGACSIPGRPAPQRADHLM